MSWKTANERRPDLEQLVVNPPTEYIGYRVFPSEFKRQQSGTIYYVGINGGTVAQSGRSQQGGSISKTYIASSYTTFSCSEKVGRFAIPAIEVDNMGGVEKSDEVGGRAAKRSVMAAIEGAQAVALFGGTSSVYAYSTYGDFFATVDAAFADVRLYAGRTALVCAASTYRDIIRLPEVKERLAFTGFNFADPSAVLSINKDVLLSCLKGVFGVDEILVGDDAYWGGDNAGKAVICKLPSEEEMSYKMNAELGKTITYQIEDTPFAIESHPDETLRENVYDGVVYCDVKVLNVGARAIITGIDTAAAAAGKGLAVNVTGGTVVTIDGGTVGA